MILHCNRLAQQTGIPSLVAKACRLGSSLVGELGRCADIWHDVLEDVADQTAEDVVLGN